MGDARGDDTHVAPFKQGLRAHGESATIQNESYDAVYIYCQ